MKYNPDTDKVDHSIEIDKLYGRIRELSQPCDKLFGWVPKILTLIVFLPIFIIGILAAGTLAREFTDLIFEIFKLSHPIHDHHPDPNTNLFHICFMVGFFISGWVLSRGVGAIDREARGKVNELNKGQILAIRARIQFLESKSKE
jgi:hypothetical protein